MTLWTAQAIVDWAMKYLNLIRELKKIAILDDIPQEYEKEEERQKETKNGKFDSIYFWF